MATKQHVEDLRKILNSTSKIHSNAISKSGASEANIKKATEVDTTSISLRTANLGRVTFAEQSGNTNIQRGNNILGFLREGLIRFLISIDICIVLLRSKDILVNDIELSVAFMNKLKVLYDGLCKSVVAGPATIDKKNIVRDALNALLAEPLPANVREALRKCVSPRVPTNGGYDAYMKNVNTLVNIAWKPVQPPVVQPPVVKPSVVQPPVVKPPVVQPAANLGLPPPGPPPSGNQGFTEEQKSYFKILGIEPTLDETAILRAFRTASLKEHPNKGGNAEKFKLINNARDKLIELIQMRRTGLTPEQQAAAASRTAAAEEAAAAAEQEAAAAAARARANNNARTRKEAEDAAARAAAQAALIPANVNPQVRANANAAPLLFKNIPPAFTGSPQPPPAWLSNLTAQQKASVAAADAANPRQAARPLPEGPGPGYTGPLAKMSNYQNSSPADEARLAAGNLVKGGNISASVPTTAEGLRALIDLQNIDNAPQFRTALSDGKRLRNKSGNSLTETDKKTLLLFKKYVTYSKEVDVTKPDQLKVRPGSSRKFTAKGNMLIAFGAKGGNDVLQLHPDNLILNENGFGITGMTTHNGGERFIYLEGLSPQQYDVMVSLIGKVKDILKNKFNPGGLTFGRGAEVYGGRRTRVAKRRTPIKKTRGSRKATRRNRRS